MAGSTLFVNGTIRTMDPRRPTAAALTVQDGRITALASGEAIARLRAEAAFVVDLAGQALLPGFVDPHNHLAVAALQGFWADCRTPPLGTIADIQAALRATAARTPAGDWVRGVGYHHTRLAERRHPTRGELDEAVPDRPAFLVHFTHHQGVANSRALALAGISRGTPDPPGGEIGRDRAGESTGLLFERAMALVERASRAGREASFAEVVARVSRDYAVAGLTLIQDAAVGPTMATRYAEAAEAGRLAIRVEPMAVSDSGWFEPPWDRAAEPGRGRTLKLFVDGGYRCAMRLPRDGREIESGFLFYRPDELSAMLVRAWRSGWRVTCHALGNLGVETAVAAIEEALRQERSGEGRVRLDHAMFVTPSLIARIRALGVRVVSQPSFLYDLGAPSFPLPAELFCHAFARLREAGIPQAFSSDYPCGSLSPLVGVAAAVTRRSREGDVVDAAQAVAVDVALAAYTIEAARAIGLEAECGSLEPGKRADLVILDRDPLATPPEELIRLRVVGTFVAGRQAWPESGTSAHPGALSE